MKGGREGMAVEQRLEGNAQREEVPGAIVYARMKERECEIRGRKREVVCRRRRRSICISNGRGN